jgi:hypothetical protein
VRVDVDDRRHKWGQINISKAGFPIAQGSGNVDLTPFI